MQLRQRVRSALAGPTLTASGKAGINRLRFQGRISSRRRLALGTYTLLVSGRDAAGNSSTTRTFRITLVR